jgi:hypothetical protein
MTVKINYEKLKQALDALYEAIDYSGMHYVKEIKTECYRTTIIKGLDGSIEVPVEYLPMLALKLLMEFEHVKDTIEIVAKRFREGKWE